MHKLVFSTVFKAIEISLSIRMKQINCLVLFAFANTFSRKSMFYKSSPAHGLQIHVLQIVHILQIQSMFYKSNPFRVLQYAIHRANKYILN